MDVFIVGYVMERPMSISLSRPNNLIEKSSNSLANANCLDSPLQASCKLESNPYSFFMFVYTGRYRFRSTLSHSAISDACANIFNFGFHCFNRLSPISWSISVAMSFISSPLTTSSRFTSTSPTHTILPFFSIFSFVSLCLLALIFYLAFFQALDFVIKNG